MWVPGVGLVQLFTGDGKGKTSAALGVVVRALGHGLKVRLIFFMKGDYPYGEYQLLSQFPNIRISRFGRQYFVDPLHVKPSEREQARADLVTEMVEVKHPYRRGVLARKGFEY